MVDFYSQIPKITISTLLVAYFDSKKFESNMNYQYFI